ncbi:hypothetical protein B0H11DRAFT_2261788 [Mycena galericulata]|nr:hypothetical protein B0H11DRAFT_2261788 [Mycena galericulata]
MVRLAAKGNVDAVLSELKETLDIRSSKIFISWKSEFFLRRFVYYCRLKSNVQEFRWIFPDALADDVQAPPMRKGQALNPTHMVSMRPDTRQALARDMRPRLELSLDMGLLRWQLMATLDYTDVQPLPEFEFGAPTTPSTSNALARAFTAPSPPSEEDGDESARSSTSRVVVPLAGGVMAAWERKAEDARVGSEGVERADPDEESTGSGGGIVATEMPKTSPGSPRRPLAVYLIACTVRNRAHRRRGQHQWLFCQNGTWTAIGSPPPTFAMCSWRTAAVLDVAMATLSDNFAEMGPATNWIQDALLASVKRPGTSEAARIMAADPISAFVMRFGASEAARVREINDSMSAVSEPPRPTHIAPSVAPAPSDPARHAGYKPRLRRFSIAEADMFTSKLAPPPAVKVLMDPEANLEPDGDGWVRPDNRQCRTSRTRSASAVPRSDIVYAAVTDAAAAHPNIR